MTDARAEIAPPRAYAMFKPLFAQMSDPMARVLAGLLPAFARASEAVTIADHHTDGDFAGFDGLANRGALADLLESEWLMRTLEPEDFIRRMAEGEVLYRKRAFSGAGKRRVLAAVLDCGPWMLGRNRLVALAALFYLAHRAERLGAVLHWCVPEPGASIWIEGLSQETIPLFLHRIVQTALSQQDIDAALDALPTEGAWDFWYVGARRASATEPQLDIGSGILIHGGHGATAEVDLIRQRRQTTRIAVNLPDDDTCVAAMRRPFNPVRSRSGPRRAPGKNGQDGLSVVPYHQDWLLDRNNQAVLVRLGEGILVQPVAARGAGVWVPTPKEAKLLGVEADPGGHLNALVLAGQQLRLHRLDLTKRTQMLRASGAVHLPSGTFGNVGLGSLSCTKDSCALVDQSGQIHRMALDGSAITLAAASHHHVLFTDGMYLIEVSDRIIKVINLRREHTLMTEPCATDPDWLKHPRRVLFTPNSKVLCVTSDNLSHTVFGLPGTPEIVLPEGLTLLHCEVWPDALVWEQDSARLLRYDLESGRHSTLQSRPVEGTLVGQPRFCPLTRTTFALTQEDANHFGRIEPLQTKGGWSAAAPFDVLEAVEAAETIWLSV